MNTAPVSPDIRSLVDLVLAYTVANVGLNLNVDYLNDKPSGFDNLIGASLMAHLPVNDHFALNARGEFVHNKDPITSASGVSRATQAALASARSRAAPAASRPAARAACFIAVSSTAAGRTVKRSPAPASTARRAVEAEARIRAGESDCKG